MSPDRTDGAHFLYGRMALRFARSGERTVLATTERTPPFHVQRLLYLDAARPWLAFASLLNTTAGLFAGDHLCLEVAVAPGAAAALGTPTMTRAYAMPNGHAVVQTRLNVATGGYLEYLPQPTLLCAGTELEQRVELHVEPHGRLAYGDMLLFGRIASGERHAFRRLDQRLELWIGSDLLLADSLAIEPRAGEAGIDAPGFLGPYNALGTLLLIGVHEIKSLLQRVRICLEGPDRYAGVSTLQQGHVLVARVLGASASTVFQAAQAVMTAYRTACSS